MKDYFQLQYKMLNRQIIAAGIPLVLGYTLTPTVFIVLSVYLFSVTNYGHYLYGAFALVFVLKLSNPERTDFLKTIFSKKKFHQLRIIENLICVSPFSLFLVYEGLLIWAVALLFSSSVFAVFNIKTSVNITLPTPFGKKPFEFLVGFRKTFVLYPLVYAITYFSIAHANFNLGLFAIACTALLCMSYYSNPESEYLVWNYNSTPKKFLVAKLKSSLINFQLLSAPIVVALSLAFFEQSLILLSFLALCNAYLCTIVFAKYSDFPNKTNVSQGILIGISILLPPFLLILIPRFYAQSLHKLSRILG